MAKRFKNSRRPVQSVASMGMDPATGDLVTMPVSTGGMATTSDITKVGGTTVTGRDISLDLKALTDNSIKGVLKSIGDAGAGSTVLQLLASAVSYLTSILAALVAMPVAQWEPLSSGLVSLTAEAPCTLDTGLYGGRTCVNYWVQNNTNACVFQFQASDDNINWIIVEEQALGAAGGAVFRQVWNSFRYLRIKQVSSTGGTIYSRIAASR